MRLIKFLPALAAAAAMSACCDKNCQTEQPAATEIVPADAAIRLNVFYTLKDYADPAAAKAAGDSLVAASRTDEGCISYDMYESVTTPGQYIIVETWENDSLLGVHSRAPHFEKYVPVLQSLGTMQTQRFLVEE